MSQIQLLFATTGGGGPPAPDATRGLWGGGTTGSNSNVIDYIEFATGGAGTDFGDLTVVRRLIAAAASSTRGLWGGGFTTVNVNVIDYVTIASPGNATDFGDLSVTRRNLAGLSSSTRACFGGGIAATGSNVIDYVTIASPGNATDFGDLTVARWRLAAAASTTRGVFAGGTTNDAGDATGFQNVIDYITIASAGNATDFGDLTVSRREFSGGASATRAVFAGGSFWNGSAVVNSNVIDYITIASAGNAIDFGDLTAASNGSMTAASQVSALIAHGTAPDVFTVVTTVDKVTIASAGNATDYADLTVARNVGAACSNGHGGL